MDAASWTLCRPRLDRLPATPSLRAAHERQTCWRREVANSLEGGLDRGTRSPSYFSVVRPAPGRFSRRAIRLVRQPVLRRAFRLPISSVFARPISSVFAYPITSTVRVPMGPVVRLPMSPVVRLPNSRVVRPAPRPLIKSAITTVNRADPGRSVTPAAYVRHDGAVGQLFALLSAVRGHDAPYRRAAGIWHVLHRAGGELHPPPTGVESAVVATTEQRTVLEADSAVGPMRHVAVRDVAPRCGNIASAPAAAGVPDEERLPEGGRDVTRADTAVDRGSRGIEHDPRQYAVGKFLVEFREWHRRTRAELRGAEALRQRRGRDRHEDLWTAPVLLGKLRGAERDLREAGETVCTPLLIGASVTGGRLWRRRAEGDLETFSLDAIQPEAAEERPIIVPPPGGPRTCTLALGRVLERGDVDLPDQTPGLAVQCRRMHALREGDELLLQAGPMDGIHLAQTPGDHRCVRLGDSAAIERMACGWRRLQLPSCRRRPLRIAR